MLYTLYILAIIAEAITAAFSAGKKTYEL